VEEEVPQAPDANDLSADCPWPGLKSYNEDDQEYFFGRGDEITELVWHVRRNTLTVVFGASGTGKTSLIQAGVFPVLRRNGLTPLRIRLLHGGNLIEQVRSLAGLTGDTLWEGFHRLAAGRSEPVIMFDQFEELFTLGEGRPESEQFLEELSEVIENYYPKKIRERLDRNEQLGFDHNHQRYHVVLVLREDFVWRLDGLRARMPSIMRERFVLEPFNEEEAIEAVEKPGKEILDSEVAQRIVAFAVGPGGSAVVEPAILSLLCRELSKRIAPAGRISAHELKGDSETIISDFWEKSIVGLPAASRKAVREFIEDRLVSPNGFRTAWPRKELARHNDAVEQLIDGRILRAELRFGSSHLELTHDVLTNVVSRSRDSRKEKERLEREDLERREREERIQEDLRRSNLLRWWSTAAALAMLAIATTIAWMALSLRSSKINLEDTVKRLKGAQQELKKQNAALETFRGRLLRQSGWPESRVTSEKIDDNTLEEVLQANEKLQTLEASRKSVRILYHPKDADWKESMDRLIAFWRSQGYQTERLPSYSTAASNVIWFRGEIPVIDLKRIALSLIRAGVRLRGIDRLPGAGAEKIEIGYDPKFYYHVPWTVEELVARRDFDSPRVVRDATKAAYVLVIRPSDPEFVQSILSQMGAGPATRWDDARGPREMATAPGTIERAKSILQRLTSAGIRAEIRNL
jgi:hypothetical protein